MLTSTSRQFQVYYPWHLLRYRVLNSIIQYTTSSAEKYDVDFLRPWLRRFFEDRLG